ncbi:MAG: AbrB/MazE/SpoVT family DNA-binding domain-containing protein [bacterium]|nr:AbrB/MazE/SpoVT family DNA-binding domain-containing protein [bacterium]
MPSATITSKGQITIPKKIRDELNLKAGDVLNFETESNSKITISVGKKHYSEIIGKFNYKKTKPEGLTPEEMDEGVAEYFRKKYRVK